MSGSIETWWGSLPIVSKYLMAGCVGMSLLSAIGVLSGSIIAFFPDKIFYHFEIWRIVTSLLFLGPPSLPFLMSVVILAQYSPIVEKEFFLNVVADYVWFLVCVGVVLILVGGLLLGDYFFGVGLVFAIMYMYSRHMPDGISSIWGFQFKTAYLPWAYIVFNFLLGGFPLMQIIGTLAGHVYFYLSKIWPERGGFNIVQTPQFMYNLFPPPARARVFGFGANVAPPQTGGGGGGGGSGRATGASGPQQRTGGVFSGTGYTLGSERR